jgi:myo-inositol 2-dehydrogenase/D-chiro-inositol 1-dehydrogenase
VSFGERLRVAVVGAGRMGRTHLDALALSRRAVAVAVVDPDPARRAAAVVDPGLPRPATYADVEALLAAGGFDAALISTPTDLHLSLVRRFAEAGVPVLCEKPCGLTAGEAAEAARAGILLQVGYWRRFVPSLQGLRARDLGEPSLVVCHQWDEHPPPPGFRDRSGGIAIDMAVHEIDQVRWLLGQEFGEVTAVGASGGDDPDTAVAVSRLSGGTVATITLGRRFARGDTCWLEVFGGAEYVREEFMTGDEDFLAALVAQADAFAAAVAGEEQIGATGDDAVAALRVAEQIGAALRSG